MGEQSYHDEDPRRLDDDRDQDEGLPYDDWAAEEEEAAPPGMEDFELPTRQIGRIDPAELEDFLAETRVSPTVPGDLPPENMPGEDMLPLESDTDDDAPEVEFFQRKPVSPEDYLQETVVNPAMTHDEPTRVPMPRDPARDAAGRDVIPSRSYSDTLPQAAQIPAQPPVYGGFEDRSSAAAQDSSRRKRRTARERRDSGLYFPWWSLLILLAGVALVAALIFMGLNALGGQFLPGGETPVVIVVTSTATPTATRPPVTPTPRLPTATPTAVVTDDDAEETSGEQTPDSVITPAPEQFEVRIGAEVEVFDVGPAGLNVRSGAGTNFPVQLIAQEGSRFEVIAGPTESGGFTWWQIRSVDDATVEGWAVVDFLRVPE